MPDTDSDTPAKPEEETWGGQYEEGGEATNIQILTIAIALGTSFLAALTGVLLNKHAAERPERAARC